MEKTILNGSVKDWIINTYTKCLKTDLLEEISPCHTIFHFLWYHQSFLSSTIFGWFYENHDHCYIFFQPFQVAGHYDWIIQDDLYCLGIFIWQCDFFCLHSATELILWNQDIILPLLPTLYSDLLQRKIVSVSVFCIGTQPPTLFRDRTNIYPISFSIQRKLVFNQKLVIKKEKYYWDKWPLPN